MKNLIKNIIKEQVTLISEMGLDDVVLKFIMNTYDNSDDEGKQKISIIMTHKPNKSREYLLNRLRLMDYNEINQIRKEIIKELFLKEYYEKYIKISNTRSYN